ncbi:hypothetical protein FSP39_010034 [Pinctada imbricata]|uniref:Transcription factor 25 n=1 Tax=Pinctada imbricata TaxID=66713 RepID=A0AA89BKI2_PINIB|nr:hypothetical protein FSP39_010034 [Pinctada imbricata]
MSSRALRKLHGKQDIDNDISSSLPQDREGSEEEGEELVIPKLTKGKKNKRAFAPVNPFELLDDEENETENQVNNETNEQVDEQNSTGNCNSTNNNNQATKKKKKKKKKKQKDGEKTANTNQEEDIEATIEEVNRILESSGAMATDQLTKSTGFTDNKALLLVEHKNLNPDNEMKRKFGSRVVQAEASRRQPRNRRQRQRMSWLTTPRENWPHPGRTGLSMTHLETANNGLQYFTYEHNHQYQQVQFQFYDAVESLNPQNIADIIRNHPFHVDGLIQLSEVFRMSEDMGTATELIERALYSCEMAFHSLFSLTTGTCRLDFRRNENRAFYLALFKHIVYVGQKGCYRTALEFCKLLLSLDPDTDPMGVLLMIDFYALRADEYGFLIRMFEEWEDHRNLSQLPNFAFSVPLAIYLNLLSKDDTDFSRADQMLQDALIMFPGMLTPLLDKCGINPDAQVTSHSFFGPNSQFNQTTALKQLIGLYVGRCHASWKQPEVMQWLERNVKEVLQRVDSNDPLVTDCDKKRKVRYQGTPRNVLRHILISEIKDAITALPPDLANTAVLSYDPVPPTDAISSYQRPERPRRAQQGNTLSLFLRSLLPNFNPDEPAPEVEGAQGGEQGNNLRQGVNALLEAMRDLLQNIQPVPAPREDDHEGEGGDRDEAEWD